MSDCYIKIERVENGFEVSIPDPKILKANAKRKDGEFWQDPARDYVFRTSVDVVKFVQANIDKRGADEYADAFADEVKKNS